ncbi:hypothetical protein Poly24_26720 [Rosistilla carotiformis]|uniref:Uncharacterized protein n=1 Tax=Rosistilla carotiformis TaxID=2528017 RepID=A0A518JTT8_9BACT|nr:hypothetical protein [Rosistilla carotiformis]QDV68959.1 hypothetical protein Poly24_26720 [Rosistilla carotiformis]
MNIFSSIRSTASCALLAPLLLAPAIVLAESPASQPPLAILAEPITNADGQTQAWPEVVMQDGMDAEQQRKVIASLGRRFEDFTKEGINSPIDIPRAVKKSVDGGVFRTYSYFFTVHTSLETLSDENLLTKLFSDNKNDQGEGEDLGAVGDDKYSYAHEPDLLKRISLSMVLRSNDAKSDASVYAGSIVVAADPENRHQSSWAPLDSPDEKQPYLGMGIYTKATPLVELPDVLFFEAHMVFYEPKAWFRGKNLLGAKLPIMIQDQVRTLRRGVAR